MRPRDFNVKPQIYMNYRGRTYRARLANGKTQDYQVDSKADVFRAVWSQGLVAVSVELLERGKPKRH
jgi:hypothetical protein